MLHEIVPLLNFQHCATKFVEKTRCDYNNFLWEKQKLFTNKELAMDIPGATVGADFGCSQLGVIPLLHILSRTDSTNLSRSRLVFLVEESKLTNEKRHSIFSQWAMTEEL